MLTAKQLKVLLQVGSQEQEQIFWTPLSPELKMAATSRLPHTAQKHEHRHLVLVTSFALRVCAVRSVHLDVT